MRTRDPDPATRRKLLDAAEALMLSKGFVAATVDEICAGAKVTKGSFFHYFESKEELGKAVLEHFTRKQEERFVSACSTIEDPLERIYAFIDCMIEGSGDSRGCLVGTFVQEIHQTHPALREVCSNCFERFAEAVRRDLVEAKAVHAPRASFDPRHLGEYFLALGQGSILLMKAKQDRKVVARNLRHFKEHLKSLYGK